MKIVQLNSDLTDSNNYKFCILGGVTALDYTIQLTKLWDFSFLQKGTYNTIGDLIK